MCGEWGWIQSAAGHCIDGLAYTMHIDSRITFVSIDHVEAAPVPHLHVDLAGTVLVIAGDHEAAALSGQFSCEIQGPLLADGLDHYVTETSFREAPHLLDELPVIAHLDHLMSIGCANDIERVGAARDRNNMGAGVHRQLDQK